MPTVRRRGAEIVIKGHIGRGRDEVTGRFISIAEERGEKIAEDIGLRIATATHDRLGEEDIEVVVEDHGRGPVVVVRPTKGRDWLLKKADKEGWVEDALDEEFSRG